MLSEGLARRRGCGAKAVRSAAERSGAMQHSRAQHSAAQHGAHAGKVQNNHWLPVEAPGACGRAVKGAVKTSAGVSVWLGCLLAATLVPPQAAGHRRGCSADACQCPSGCCKALAAAAAGQRRPAP